MPRAQCSGLVWGGLSYQLLICREHAICFYPTHFQKIVNVWFFQHYLQTFSKDYLNLCGSNCIQLALCTPYLRRASAVVFSLHCKWGLGFLVKMIIFFLTASGISDQVRCSVYQWDFALSLQVVSEDALVHWLDQYNSSADTCTHAYWLVLSCCFTYFQV